MTDTLGRFQFSYNKPVQETDSLTISALGFETSMVRLSDLRNAQPVYLVPQDKFLENVVVVSTLKIDQESFAYYKAWDPDVTGEIGQILDLPFNRVQIGSVEVKINQNYDTCWLRLHIRTINPDGLPEQDLLKREVLVKAAMQDGIVEFPVEWQQFRFPSKQAYIGFEVVRCGSCKSGNPSFFFTGTEHGFNIFRRWNLSREWEISPNYTIYIRATMK